MMNITVVTEAMAHMVVAMVPRLSQEVMAALLLLLAILHLHRKRSTAVMLRVFARHTMMFKKPSKNWQKLLASLIANRLEKTLRRLRRNMLRSTRRLTMISMWQDIA
jgi:hypothetical protein